MRKTPLWVFVVLFLSAASVMGVAVLASLHLDMSVGKLTRDFATLADVHPLTGGVSHLGILLCCGAAAVCLFGAALTYQRQLAGPFLFLLASGLLSLFLCLDDLYQFHDDLAERYLGVSELAVYAFYGLGGVIYLFAFRRRIVDTDYPLLLTAFAFFAVMVSGDLISLDLLGMRWTVLVMLEDGAKFFGIVFWCGYYVRTSLQMASQTQKIEQDAVEPHGAAQPHRATLLDVSA